MKLSDLVDFNPKRPLKKGVNASFVEMAYLPENERDIKKIGKKTFTGGGSKFANGDTLFARITPCLENGKTSLVSNLKDEEIAFGSTEFIVLSAKAPKYDSNYIYYLTRLPEFRLFAQSRMEGTSGRQRVSWQALAEYEYTFPDRALRKYAGDFLKNLDDKIQLNYQINETLEKMAQAMFKSWFINFEPVKAKIAVIEAGGSLEDSTLAAMASISGKDIKSLATLEHEQPRIYAELRIAAELFPSEMQESGVGDIPIGWDVVRLSDITNLKYGKALKKTERTIGSYPVYGSGGITGYHNNYLVEGPGIIIGRKGSIGTIYWEDDNFFPIDTVYYVENNKNLPLCYLYYLLQTLNLPNMNTDAAIPGLNRENVYRLDVVRPAQPLIDYFAKYVATFKANVQSNNKSNKILMSVRDALLPKLLSGDIPLKRVR